MEFEFDPALAVPAENQDPLDSSFQILTFYRRMNPDGLLPAVFDARGGTGNAVRLAVKTGEYPGPLGDRFDEVNDRCELREPHKLRFPTAVWYGFSIRVPDNFPAVKQRCVLAQIKCPYDKSQNGSPAFSLRIDDRHWFATIEHLYEEDDLDKKRFLTTPKILAMCPVDAAPADDHSNFVQGSPDYSAQVRAVLATDAQGLPEHLLTNSNFSQCTSGVRVHTYRALPPVTADWVDFILYFKPSPQKNEDGQICLYVNNQPIAEATGEFGMANGKPFSQYFKIGPYRNNDPKNTDVVAEKWPPETIVAIDVMNLRRGGSFEAVKLPEPEAPVA